MADITRGFFIEVRDVTRGVLLNGTVSAGDPIGQDGTGWVRAKAGSTTVSCQAFAMMDGVSTDRISICQAGLYQTSATLTQGNMVFLSNTAGRIADADPGSVIIQTHVLGWVIGASPTGLIALNANIVHEYANFQTSLATVIIAAAGTSFYIARRPMRFLGCCETHSVACSSSGTYNIVKAATATAVGAGTSVLTGGSTVALNTTADTPVYTAPHATAATARLATGDRLMCLIAGTLTGVVDVQVTAQLVALER